MSHYWKPSSQCADHARKCARELLAKHFGHPHPRGNPRPKYYVATFSPVTASNDVVTVSTCPHCSRVSGVDNDTNTSTDVQIPKYLFVDVTLRIPISSIPDKYRDGASTDAKIERALTASPASPLNIDALADLLRD